MSLFTSGFGKKIVAYMLLILSISACTNIFFQPMTQHLASPEQYNIEYEDLNFQGASGLRLHGWWFPANLQNNIKAKADILFLHGNAENISTHSGLVYWLTEHQYNVFVFDYRGYGKSEGEANLAGIMQDIKSAREYLYLRNISLKDTQKKKIFMLGHSLGASLAIHNIAKYPEGIDGVILMSPFSDYQKIAQEVMAKSWMTWMFQWVAYITVNADYNPIDYVALLPDVPKLFAYSDEDQIIDSEHIKKLYTKANREKYLEKIKGNHNGVFAYKENQKILLKYLNEWSDSDVDK